MNNIRIIEGNNCRYLSELPEILTLDSLQTYRIKNKYLPFSGGVIFAVYCLIYTLPIIYTTYNRK